MNKNYNRRLYNDIVTDKLSLDSQANKFYFMGYLFFMILMSMALILSILLSEIFQRIAGIE